MRSALGVQRAAFDALVIHFASEPISENRADDEDSTQHGDRYQDIRELFQLGLSPQAIHC